MTAGAALVADVLGRFGRIRIRALGTSMLPTIQSGDVLDVQRCPSDQLEDGDIVLVYRAGVLCAHRMVGRGGGDDQRGVVTRGDAHWCRDDDSDAVEVLGRVVRVTRGSLNSDVLFDLSSHHRLLGLARNELMRIVAPIRRLLFRIGRIVEIFW